MTARHYLWLGSGHPAVGIVPGGVLDEHGPTGAGCPHQKREIRMSEPDQAQLRRWG